MCTILKSLKKKWDTTLISGPIISFGPNRRFRTKINDNFSTVFLQEHFSHSCPRSKDKSGGRLVPQILPQRIGA
jgi:hypothetical protein